MSKLRYNFLPILLLNCIAVGRAQEVSFQATVDQHSNFLCFDYSYMLYCDGSGSPIWGDSTLRWGCFPTAFDLRKSPMVQGLEYTFRNESDMGDTSFNFSLDTSNRTVHNLKVYYNGSSNSHNSEWSYELRIDSLRYSGSLQGLIECHDSNIVAAYFDTTSEQFSQRTYWCGGGGKDKGTIPFSYVNFQFKLHGPLSVKNRPIERTLAIKFNGMELMLLYNILEDQSLEVFDQVGRLCLKMSLSSEENEVQIPKLLPGCYFARLGTEVAKFCVME